MDAKFPILEFIKQSFVQTFSFGKGLLVTLAAIIAIAVAIIVVFLLLGVALAGTGGGATGAMIFGGLVSVVIALYGMGWIFNYWARVGADGRENLFPDGFGATLTPALATGLKLLFIGILVCLVAIVVIMITGILGIGVTFDQLPRLGTMDSLEVVQAMGFAYLIVFGVSCAVYSVFSSNLTKTALGREDEEIGEPHVLEFALVLFFIYAACYVPLMIVQAVAPKMVGVLLEYVVGIFLLALIPVAHGLRYDWQRQVYAARQSQEPMGE